MTTGRLLNWENVGPVSAQLNGWATVSHGFEAHPSESQLRTFSMIPHEIKQPYFVPPSLVLDLCRTARMHYNPDCSGIWSGAGFYLLFLWMNAKKAMTSQSNHEWLACKMVSSYKQRGRFSVFKIIGDKDKKAGFSSNLPFPSNLKKGKCFYQQCGLFFCIASRWLSSSFCRCLCGHWSEVQIQCC